jgi:glucuronate isomerase
MPQTRSFIDDDTFLLGSDIARKLYHEHAANMPIYDYHCHLSPRDLADNRTFNNLFEIWLEGDHYKWRAMRAAGVAERYCTGDADPWDKFLAFARTVPQTLRNPLYHWTHLELSRYFGIDLLLNQDTAREVWDEANRQLQQMPVAAILDRFNVALIGTTDDPADTLEHHRRLSDAPPFDTAVYPAFRPDKACNIADTRAFNDYVGRLSRAAQLPCNTLAEFKQAVRERHDFFHDMGSRLSDHGLTHLPAADCNDAQAAAIFDKARGGEQPNRCEQEQFTAYMMLYFGELDAARGWVKQLHLGAMRNNNAWAMKHLGPDTGFDSIGDYPQGEGLAKYLGTLAGRKQLPKTILYNLNPRDNYLFATMAGNFNGAGDPDSPPGKMQFGSGWWFLDQKEGMTWQLNALSNLGLLPRFVGMLTDSRSFMSYPRHEYFRRLLCNLLANDAQQGELPDDTALLGQIVEDICFNNARHYFNLTLRGRYT